MSELPNALRSVAEVLDLAPGFALCVVTGPRDRCDSVYLRLVRALGDRLELVRHRVDHSGVDLHAALAGSSSPRPRVVFISGLEHMSNDARTDAIARLNLVRDSWAPHAARVILWLPSWGLADFRRLAPDLFHWRSNLAVLHDADLPVRDETELLMWTCEHLAATWGRERWADAFPNILCTLHQADGRAVHPFDWGSRERRGVVLGLGSVERSHFLHDLSLYAAVRRLGDLLGEDAVVTAPDLDVMTRIRRIRIGLNDGGPTFAPLLVRATEAAGRLAGAKDWASIARIVGLPGPTTAATTLARLAEDGDLCVLLDGFELLDLSPGGDAGQWLAWLAEHPRLRILASAATDVPPRFAGWSVIQRSREDPPVLESDPFDALVDLLVRLFSVEELAAWHAYWFDDDSAERPMSTDSAREAAIHLLRIVSAHRMLDASFFEELKRLRPREQPAVEAIEQAFRRD